MINSPLLSVVTITKNDYTGLSRTINSLERLKNSPIELVIIDGSDVQYNGGDILDLSEFACSQIIRSNDSGIYDAMNKGLASATGNFVWFLNGGDSNLLKNLDFLHEFISEPLPVILGNYRMGTSQCSIHRRAKSISKIRHGLPTSHQAIFYPRSIFQKVGFFLEYQVCADYASIAYLYKRNQTFIHVSQEFAEFQLDGLSGRRVFELRSEARLIQERILELNSIYVGFSAARHRLSAFVRHVLQTLGELGS